MLINLKKNFYLFLILSLNILIGFVFWDYINIPINKDLVGFEGFGQPNYHPHNDTLKFFLFIVFCLLSFLYFYYKIFKNQSLNYKEIFHIDFITTKKKDLNLITLFIFFLIFLEFLNYDFKILISKIDIFHEGIWLTPSINYKITKLFWDSSYFERGIGGNFFPVFIWNLTKTDGIGSVRLLDIFCLMLNKIFIVLICKFLSENLLFDKKIKILFFLILSICSISLVSYPDVGYGYFGFRHSLLLLFVVILLKSFEKANKNLIINFLLGAFSSFSILWYLDVGFYTNLLIVLYSIFLVFKKKSKSFFSLIIGLLFSWLFFYLIFSTEEIKLFFENIYNVSSTIEYIGSLKYPSPLFGGDSRATKTLIFFVIIGALITYIFFNKKIFFSNNNKIALIFLYVLSLIAFKYALGRSDSYHIKGGSGLLMLLLFFLILFFLFDFIQKLNQNFFNYVKKIYLFYFLLFFFVLESLDSQKYKNIFFFKNNISKLINAPIESFIDEDYKDLIKIYNSITYNLDENCVQIFTDEIALPYLIKKQSCTKYYAMITATPKKIQLNFIDELIKKKPRILLFKSKKFEFTPHVEKRLTLVNEFINSNYSVYQNFKSWTFYKINQY